MKQQRSLPVTVHLVHPYPLARVAVGDWLAKESYIQLDRKLSSLSDIETPFCSGDNSIVIGFCYDQAELVDQIIAIRKNHPTLKIIIATNHDSPHLARELIYCGVHGYVGIDAGMEEWEWTIKSVAEGRHYYGQQAIKQLIESKSEADKHDSMINPKSSLSTREIEVLKLVINEFSTNRIATKLFISTKTVETHRRKLFQKLGVKNVVGLTKSALKLGLI